MALIGAVAIFVLAWISRGHPLQPVWALSLLPLAFWLFGLVFRRGFLLSLGFFGFLALSVECVFSGYLPLGLGVLGLALFSWDSAAFFYQREKIKVPGASWRGLWSAIVVGTGVGLGFSASLFRLSLNFWALAGALALLFLLLRALVKEMIQGRETKGNRSTSDPTG